MRPWATIIVVAFAAVAALIPVVPCTAHDIWITTTGPPDARRAVINYGHPHDRPPTVGDKVVDLFAYTSDGRQSLIDGLTTAEDAHGVLVVETRPFRNDRSALLAVRYDNGYWVKTADGYRNATTRAVPEARDSLWSMKFGKALTGPGAPWGKVLGHQLEIVPLDDPLTVPPGSTLRVRVLFGGRPLQGGKVERGDGLTPVAEDDIPRFVTDADGIAAIPVVKSGPMQLAIDHVVTPSATPGLAAKDMFNATLWYIAPQR